MFDIEELISSCVQGDHASLIADNIRSYWVRYNPIKTYQEKIDDMLEFGVNSAQIEELKSQIAQQKLLINNLRERLHNRQDNEIKPVVEDGWGNTWTKCELQHRCGLQIVRPGQAQCDCEHEYSSQDISKLFVRVSRLEKQVESL